MTQKGNAVTDIPTEAETKQREKLFPNYTRVCREAEEGIIPDISKQNGKKNKTQKDHRKIGGERDVGSTIFIHELKEEERVRLAKKKKKTAVLVQKFTSWGENHQLQERFR